jgi:hypothetical protein
MISTIFDWHSGDVGLQSIPWIASTGRLAVFGIVGQGNVIPSGSSACRNEALPYVVQSHNLAIVAYHPNSTLKALKAAQGTNFDVLIYWPFASFSETVTLKNWTVSREDNTYVAIRPIYLSTDKMNSVIKGSNYIWSDADPSVWTIIVGNANLYGNFSYFQSLLSASTISNIVTTNFLTSTVILDGNKVSLELPL